MEDQVEPVDGPDQLSPDEHLELLDDVGWSEWRQTQCQTHDNENAPRNTVNPGYILLHR